MEARKVKVTGGGNRREGSSRIGGEEKQANGLEIARLQCVSSGFGLPRGDHDCVEGALGVFGYSKNWLPSTRS